MRTLLAIAASFPCFAAASIAQEPAPPAAAGRAAPQLQAPPATRVRVVGRVLSVLYEGLPAAEVWATDGAGATVGRTVADGDGYFQLPRLPASARELHASADGRATGSIELPPTGALRAATLMLEDGEPLAGVVVRADGTPIAGAMVCVAPIVPLQAPFAWRDEVAADAQGAWRVAAAPLRPLTVCAWSPGCKPAQVTVGRRAAAPLRLVLEADAVAQRTVRVGGLQPGQNATVRCEPCDRQYPQPLPSAMLAAPVGGDGVARLWTLPLAHYVVVDAPGSTSQPVAIPTRAGGTTDVAFELTPLPADRVAPRTRMIGRLVDGTVAPVAGAAVLAKSDDAVLGPFETDADGAFVLDAPVRAGVLFRVGLVPGRWRLGGEHAELETDGVVWRSVTASVDRPLTLAVAPAAALRATLRTANGAPLAALRLELRHVGKGPVLVGASDLAGNVHVPGLPPGTYAWTLARDGVQVAAGSVDAPAGGAVGLGDVAITAGTELYGTMRDADGVGATGAFLLHRQPVRGAGMPASARLVLTDRNGRYRAPGVVAGAWQVVPQQNPLLKPGGAGRGVVVVADEPRIEWNIDAPR